MRSLRCGVILTFTVEEPITGTKRKVDGGDSEAGVV